MTANEPKPHQEWMFAFPDPEKRGSFGEPFIAGNMQHVVEANLKRGAKVVDRDPSGKLVAVEVELGAWGYEKKVPAKPSTPGGDK